jgi:hypothetical protein
VNPEAKIQVSNALEAAGILTTRLFPLEFTVMVAVLLLII